MDKASAYGAGDCRLESYRGHFLLETRALIEPYHNHFLVARPAPGFLLGLCSASAFAYASQRL